MCNFLGFFLFSFPDFSLYFFSGSGWPIRASGLFAKGWGVLGFSCPCSSRGGGWHKGCVRRAAAGSASVRPVASGAMGSIGGMSSAMGMRRHDAEGACCQRGSGGSSGHERGSSSNAWAWLYQRRGRCVLQRVKQAVAVGHEPMHGGAATNGQRHRAACGQLRAVRCGHQRSGRRGRQPASGHAKFFFFFYFYSMNSNEQRTMHIRSNCDY